MSILADIPRHRTTLDLNAIRKQFPALESGFIFADSAGGSQCLGSVIDKVVDYMKNTNVQLGADYVVGTKTNTRVLLEAPQATATLINASSPDEIVFTSSTTSAFDNLARALEASMESSDEIIVTGEHEANVGPWVRLAKRRDLKLHEWQPTSVDRKNPFAVSLRLDTLLPLITPSTRIVALTACSNVLGELHRIKTFTSEIRRAAGLVGNTKVQICVDCVAYAPHRRIDVQAWDADFIAFSYYKVYGPHVACLWVRLPILQSINSLAHYFIDPERPHYPPSIRLQPGGPGYELTYSTTAVLPYILSLIGDPTMPVNVALLRAFNLIEDHEKKLLEPLMEFLRGKWDKGVRIVGLATSEVHVRAPTVSFIVVGEDGRTKRLLSKDIVSKIDQSKKIGIRYGHFYAHRLLTNLGIDPDDGVVRISLVHYHTIQDVEAITKALEPILA